VTALVRRIRRVRARGRGENHRWRGIEELTPVVFADAKHIKAHLVSDRDCFE
jgi:hypothetical protein